MSAALAPPYRSHHTRTARAYAYSLNTTAVSVLWFTLNPNTHSLTLKCCVPCNRRWASNRPGGNILHRVNAHSVCIACCSGACNRLFGYTSVLFFDDSFVLCASSCGLICTAMHPCARQCVWTHVHKHAGKDSFDVGLFLTDLPATKEHNGIPFATASLPVQAHVAPFRCKSSLVCAFNALLKPSWYLLTGHRQQRIA